MSTTECRRSFTAGEALEAFRRVKVTSAATVPPTVVYADAGELAVGTTEYACANGDIISVQLENSEGTVEVCAADTFALAAVLYAANDGKVSDSASGSAIGIALEACTGGGDIIEMQPYGVKSTTAATVSVADAGNFTEAATVEAALAEIYQDIQSAQATIPIPLGAITMEDGTSLTKQATTVAGIAQMANKEQAIVIPIDCTAGEALAFSVPLPQDFDETGDLHIHVLAGKGGDLDTLTLDCEIYMVGAADTGNTDACTTSAQSWPQAVTEIVFTGALAGLIAAPCTLTAVLSLGGTNDGDASYIYGAWVEYTRKALAA